jgi:hypothetical protein
MTILTADRYNHRALNFVLMHAVPTAHEKITQLKITVISSRSLLMLYNVCIIRNLSVINTDFVDSYIMINVKSHE